MNMKKGIFVSMLAAVLGLGGCGSRNMVVNVPETDRDVTTITFFGNKYETENVTVIEEIISDFVKENPRIRVTYESLKGSEYFDALSKRMAAGQGDDVFMVNHDIVLELKKNEQLLELSGLDTIPDYTERMFDQMQEDGEIYWVPTTVSAFGLYCNKDLLKEHGREVPQNWGQWEEVCRYFAGQGITPVIVNNDISLKTLAIGKSFYTVYQEKRQKEVFYNLNTGKETLSKYLTPGFALAEDMIEHGFINAEKGLNTQKTSDDLDEFLKGESPFMLTGAWAAGRLVSMQPGFAFQVIPYPVLEDGSLLVINADTRLSVNAKSHHTEEAVKFLEFFTKKENISKFADQQSSFSPLKEGTVSSVKEIQPLISCYQADSTVIGTDSLLELPIWNLTAEVSKKLLFGEPLEQAMKWMDEQAAAERGAQ